MLRFSGIFELKILNNNEELCLDPTVTRSQMLASYPAPGTHDKFYNQNSVPLVEVIQDTVCRHDTFGWHVMLNIMKIAASLDI